MKAPFIKSQPVAPINLNVVSGLARGEFNDQTLWLLDDVDGQLVIVRKVRPQFSGLLVCEIKSSALVVREWGAIECPAQDVPIDVCNANRVLVFAVGRNAEDSDKALGFGKRLRRSREGIPDVDLQVIAFGLVTVDT
jgi:hypothetical protein